MLNLNTHNAYAGLRDKRAQLREKDEKILVTICNNSLYTYPYENISNFDRLEKYLKA